MEHIIIIRILICEIIKYFRYEVHTVCPLECEYIITITLVCVSYMDTWEVACICVSGDKNLLGHDQVFGTFRRMFKYQYLCYVVLHTLERPWSLAMALNTNSLGTTRPVAHL